MDMNVLSKNRGSRVHSAASNQRRSIPSVETKRNSKIPIIVNGQDLSPKPLFVKTEEIFFELRKSPDLTSDSSYQTRIRADTLSSTLPSMKETIDFGSIQQPFTDSQVGIFLSEFENVSIKSLEEEEQQQTKRKHSVVHADLPDSELEPQDTITIHLRETPTFFLLELPSLTAEVGSEEGIKIERDNELYNYLTIGEGHNRYTKTAEIQTLWFIKKNRETMAPKCLTVDSYAVASVYDLHLSLNMLDDKDVSFKPIPGAPPTIVFLNKFDKELERIDLAPHSREACNALLVDRGFRKKSETVQEREDF